MNPEFRSFLQLALSHVVDDESLFMDREPEEQKAFPAIRKYCDIARSVPSKNCVHFPLQQAAMKGSVEDVRAIIEYGPEFVRSFPQLAAPFEEQLSIGKCLLTHEAFSNKNNLLLVHSIAGSKGKLDVLEYLKAKGLFSLDFVSFCSA